MNMDEKKDFINEYITEEECFFDCSDKLFDCFNCDNFDECYMKSSTRCDNEYAESVDFGGFNTSEEFWDSIFN